MYKAYLVLLAAIFLNATVAFAHTPVDSIGVENNKGKKLIIHKIEAKETYYSLGKKYHVDYKDIILFNNNKSLQIGVIIKVPTDLPYEAAQAVSTSASPAVFDYTVKAKDNLNLLAERYNTTVNDIKRINNLNSINLQIGQVLKIPSNSNNVEVVMNPPSTTTQQATSSETTIEHTIKAKENLNLLAEKYGTSVDEIKRLNGLSSNNLRIGQVLKIPATNAATTTEEETEKTSQPKSSEQKGAEPNIAGGSFEHIVAAGETIYTIAKKYNLTTYQLKTANNLTKNEVSIGQKLIITGPRSVAASDGEEDSNISGNTIKDPSLRYAPSTYGIIQMEEKGTAVWISDPDLDPNKMLVLHRTAPVGTIIKVTNPMSNRSAFAKVVGKFTENESTKDVIIVITKAVADAVGALDKRFFCNLTYGAQENEQ